MDYIEYCLECLDFNVKPLNYDEWRRTNEYTQSES